MAFTSLAYLMDIDWLKEAYRRTRKDGAVGVDGVTGEEYDEDLEVRACSTARNPAHSEHRHLRQFLRLRVRDDVLMRLIDKWLKAGVMEDDSVSHPESGPPQGGVIAPPTILQTRPDCSIG